METQQSLIFLWIVIFLISLFCSLNSACLLSSDKYNGNREFCTDKLLNNGILVAGNVECSNATVMFVFGDSYADTGNHNKSWPSWRPPYGMTFPGKPSGRYSNGRVLTDFIASYFNITSPVPYHLRNDSNDEMMAPHGVNFAYGGSGVFHTFNGLPNLTAQISQLEQLVVGGVYSLQDLESSLVLVSVAGNDYIRYPESQGGHQDIGSYVKSLIEQLSIDLKLLYKMGIRMVAVTSLAPLGCLPVVTSQYSYKYCNETENKVASFHNLLLQEAVERMNKNLSGLNLVVLDLYTAFMSNFGHPQQYGNFTEPLLKPCCTGKKTSDYCSSVDNEGSALYDVCTNPNSAFFWDGLHPTQAAWHAMITSFAPSLNCLLQ